jgi:hypothetical protein
MHTLRLISALLLIWLLLLAPLAPLAWLWLRNATSTGSRLALAVLTVSYAWLLIASVTPSIQDFLLGPDGSYARTFAIPGANIAAVTLATAFLVARGGRRIGSALAGVLIVLCWVCVLIIRYVV